jgi:hypothetical protein
MLEIHAVLVKVGTLYKRLLQFVRIDLRCRRLMTMPGRFDRLYSRCCRPKTGSSATSRDSPDRRNRPPF